MLSLLAATILSAPLAAWYGPVTVISSVPYVGNPYDPDQNDVEVEFVGPHGWRFKRLAYFIGSGRFASTLVAPAPGSYSAVFTLNNKQTAVVRKPVRVTEKLPHGFIGMKGRHFEWTDGTPYFPIGYDYAWKEVGNETVAQGMTKMGLSGCNWSRIWATYWDQRNPWWPAPGEMLGQRQLRQPPLEAWDDIVTAADRADVHFQFVLFHHGEFSSTTDSNWRENPWNVANGGFLADPTDFFSNEEANKRAKIWLRYAVARYAHSPAIMSWELFNEVQWTDAAKNPARIGDVATWHKEMADYVRSIDPYHHLITSSSSENLGSHVFDAVDYMQPHTYPANVLAAIGGYRFAGKPGFFGEFGPPFQAQSDFRKLVRDGIYGGILAGHAGAGMFWSWDQVDRVGLAADYRAARRVIDESGLQRHRGAHPLSLLTDTPTHGDLLVSAGGGWEKSGTTELDLPKVDLEAQKNWSPYFQSLDGSHKDWASPFLLKFTAAEPGRIAIGIGQVSGTGGSLTVWVNDKQVYRNAFDPPASGSDSGPRRAPVAIDYPAGPVVVRLENHGHDWIRLDSVTVPGLASTAFAHGLGDRSWALLRIVGSGTSNVTVRGLELPDGEYNAVEFDVATGQRSTRRLAVRGGSFHATELPADTVIDLSR